MKLSSRTQLEYKQQQQQQQQLMQALPAALQQMPSAPLPVPAAAAAAVVVRPCCRSFSQTSPASWLKQMPYWPPQHLLINTPHNSPLAAST
jgi:hypothetical protein